MQYEFRPHKFQSGQADKNYAPICLQYTQEKHCTKEWDAFFTLFLEFSMKFFGLKAVQAFVLAGIVSGLVVSCQDGDILPTSSVPAEVAQTGSSTLSKAAVELTAQDVPFLNEQLEHIARATARTLSDPQMVKMLHAKALERFDSDTDVLWEHLDNDKAKFQGKAKGWSSLVLSKLETRGKQAFSSAQAMDVMLAKVERAMGGKLHLYWYMPEKWDGKTAPLVAYTPIDEKLGKRKDAPGYDANGKEYTITEEIAKSRPIIILTRNERTEADGSIKKRAPQSIVGGFSKNSSSLQSTYIRLRLESFSVPSSHEDWFSGGPEFVARFATTQDGNNFSEYPGWDLTGITPGECDGRIIGGWTGQWERSFYWDSTSHKTLYIQWTEEDPPAIFSGSATLSITGEFKLLDFTIKPNANFSITIPSIGTDKLQGWAIHNDHPAYPSAPLRSYNGGHPSTVVRFDPN